jgi:vitamin B12 transporter
VSRSSSLVGTVAVCGVVASLVVHTREASAQRPAQSLDTVHVRVTSRTGVATQGDRSVTVITREEIAATPARTLAELLAPRLGIDILTRSAASADIAVRGTNIEGTVILVDGVRVRDQQTGHFDLDLAVPLGAIERIEILRGTSSALYGADAVGGAINIVTRAAEDGARGRSASVAASGGSFGTATFAATGAMDGERTRLSGAADVQRSDGHRPGTDYEITQLRGAFAQRLAGGTLRADAGIGVRHFGAADFYGPFPSFEDTRATTLGAGYDRPIGARWSVSARGDARRHGDLFTLERKNPARYQNRHVSWQSGGEVVARRAKAGGLSFATGVDARELRLTSARLGDHTEQRAAVFSEATLGGEGRPSLDAGARVDWSSERGTFFSPSLAAAIPLGGRVVLRSSAARGFRAPTWTELYYSDPANVGDSTLASERFWSGEIGARASVSRRVTVDGAVFVRRAEDLIDWAKPAGAGTTVPWRTRNVDRATYRGVEGSVDVRGVAGADWTVQASGLSFDAEGAAGFRGKYGLSPITRSLGVTGTFHLGVVRLGANGVAARRVGQETNIVGNARVLVPVRAAELLLDVYNIGDAHYRDVAGKPVVGRGVYAGVRWALERL